MNRAIITNQRGEDFVALYWEAADIWVLPDGITVPGHSVRAMIEVGAWSVCS